MKKFLKLVLITCGSFLITINIYVNIQNYVGVTTLIENQGMVLGLQTYFNEINTERNRILEEKLTAQDKENEINHLTIELDKNNNEINDLAEELNNNNNEIDLATQKLKEINNLIEKSNTKPTYEYLKSVTVRVIHMVDEENDRYGTGTGSVVKITEDFTYILTNKHVAPIDTGNIYVEVNEKRYRAEVLKNGVIRDLSLIRINGKIKGKTAIKGLSKIKEQEKIYSVGMYLGLYNIYTEGTVAGWEGEDRLMNMPCLYGCSGSGVFDKNGNMVAVVFAGNLYNFMGFDTAKAICVPYIGIYAFLEEIL